jgi:hypothetical protein
MSESKRPISEKQLAANRANAQKSTGPKTQTGKARSAMNSIKHGLATATVTIVRLEDPKEVGRLIADAVAVYRPVNSQELRAVERIALEQQAMFRSHRLEAGIFTSRLNEALDRDHLLFPMTADMTNNIDVAIEQNRNYALAEGFDKMARNSTTLPLMIRYQAHHERQYRRAIEEFERLKAMRDDLPSEPIFDDEPEQPEGLTPPPANPSSEPEPAPPPPQEPAPDPASEPAACAVVRDIEVGRTPGPQPVPRPTRSVEDDSELSPLLVADRE